MKASAFAASPLFVRGLRTLSIDADLPPRGQAYLSSASGLVCRGGRAYVIADDEHHLALRDQIDQAGLHPTPVTRLRQPGRTFSPN